MPHWTGHPPLPSFLPAVQCTNSETFCYKTPSKRLVLYGTHESVVLSYLYSCHPRCSFSPTIFASHDNPLQQYCIPEHAMHQRTCAFIHPYQNCHGTGNNTNESSTNQMPVKECAPLSWTPVCVCLSFYWRPRGYFLDVLEWPPMGLRQRRGGH